MSRRSGIRGLAGHHNFVSRMLFWSLLILVALDNLGSYINLPAGGLGVAVWRSLACKHLGDLFACSRSPWTSLRHVGEALVIRCLYRKVEHIGIKTTGSQRHRRADHLSNADILKEPGGNFGRAQEQARSRPSA